MIRIFSAMILGPLCLMLLPTVYLCLQAQKPSERLFRVFKEHTGAVTTIAISSSGKLLASGDDDHIVVVWDLVALKKLRQLQGHQKPVTAVAFSPDGKILASGSEDETVLLWDVCIGSAGTGRMPFLGLAG